MCVFVTSPLPPLRMARILGLPKPDVLKISPSPMTMGDDQPLPGIGVFQTMFDVALHSTGTFFSCDMPCLLGPRKQGQLSARGEPARIATSMTMQDILRDALRQTVFTSCDTS